MEILFITGNAGKFSEAEKILKQFGLNISQQDLDLDEIRSDSVEEVAGACAKEAFMALKVPLFVEDSGLFIPSLGGFPGAYSAWAFRKVGNEGILKLAAGHEAEFRACIAYADEKGNVSTFTGSVKGKIAAVARGSAGFGYDPIFTPDKSPGISHSGEKTFAEVPEMKEALSHRRRALQKFGEFLRKNGK